MQTVSSDFSQILQLNQFALQVTPPSLTPVSGNLSQELLDDIATVSSPVNTGAGMPFDMAMNDLAAYKDIISAAQSGISQMKADGQSIKDLIAQAQQTGVSQELIDKLQAEVDEKIMDINIIKDAAESNGVNPYNSSVGVEIPASAMSEDSSATVTSMLSAGGMQAINLDLSFDVDGVSFEGSANIMMGRGEDGSFKFAFDVSLNYDLSAISGDGGITNPDASSIVDGFLNMLDSNEETLSGANKVIDAAFEKIFDAVNKTASAGNATDYMNSSSFISKQIMQQSSTVFDSMKMNQMPGLALNLI